MFHRTLEDIMNDSNISMQQMLNMIAELSSDPSSRLIQTIKIRSEKDPEKIKNFTLEERKIYLDWKKKHPISNQETEQDEAAREARVEAFKAALLKNSKRG